MKMILKVSDISNVTRPMEDMKKWCARLTEEFFLQGDNEKKSGIPITGFMDRETSTKLSIAQTQV